MSTTTEDVRWNELHDRLRIEEHLSKLGRSLDDRDFEGMRMLFTHDATVSTPGGDARGHDAIVDQARLRHHSYEGVQHLITNALIERTTDSDSDDTDRASVRANLFVSLAAGNVDPAPFLVGGVYHFTLRRTAEGWRIETLRSTSTWSMNRPTA